MHARPPYQGRRSWLPGAFSLTASALAGGGLAGRASPQRLSVAFSVLVVLVAGYILTRSLPGLV